MPMPYTKVRGANAMIEAELLKMPPPFYGVNIIDVADVDLFNTRMAPVRQRFAGLTDFRPHFRAVSDYGHLKRMLVVNFYGPDLDPAQLRELLADPAYIEDWMAALAAVEAWDFFTAIEP